MLIKCMKNFTAGKSLVAVVIILATVLSFASCEKEDTVNLPEAIADYYDGLWDSSYKLTDIQKFEWDDNTYFYIGYDMLYYGTDHHVNAIMLVSYGKVYNYVHSSDFDLNDSTKRIYNEYLNAVSADEIVTYSSEEIAEVQEKVDEIVSENSN